MNSEPNSQPNDFDSTDDLVMDSLLAEHARLGTAKDEALVSNILANTINSPVEFEPSVVTGKGRARLGAGEWSKLAAMVIGILGVGALILNSFKTELASDGVVGSDRKEDVFHVVVLSPEEKIKQNRVPAKRIVELNLADSQPVKTVNGSSYDLEITQLAGNTNLNLESISDFKQSIDISKLNQVRRPSFSVAANTTDKTKEKVIYSGQAVLTHDEFTIEADSIAMGTQSSEDGLVKAMNARISHKSSAYKAVADSISFDPVSGEVKATGVTELVAAGKTEVVDPTTTLLFNDSVVTELEVYASPETLKK